MADEETVPTAILPVAQPKKIWGYNNETGELTGQTYADPDPMSPGEYLMPAFSTDIEPPVTIEGNTLIFRNGAWGYIRSNTPEGEPTPEPQGPNIDDVAAERDARLDFAITYDFNDERGSHVLGMTPADMKGWDVVTKLSTAMILAGHPELTIDIRTGTGPVTVTAAEWQAILIHAGQVQQPYYQASFALQDMAPNIPSDYRDDKYWPVEQAEHVQQDPNLPPQEPVVDDAI